jgi:hypothetical protein
MEVSSSVQQERQLDIFGDDEKFNLEKALENGWFFTGEMILLFRLRGVLEGLRW